MLGDGQQLARIINEHEKIFQGDGFIYFLNYSDGFMVTYIYQNSLISTLYIYAVNYISVVPLKSY